MLLGSLGTSSQDSFLEHRDVGRQLERLGVPYSMPGPLRDSIILLASVLRIYIILYCYCIPAMLYCYEL